MGQLLSHPIQEKQLDYHPNASMSYAVGSMQGYRMTMEDAHSVKFNEDESLAVFGVFDGHGGRASADYVSENLPSMIFKRLNEMLRNKNINNNNNNNDTSTNNKSELSRYMSTIKDSFFKVDHDLSLQDSTHCGTTAILACVIAQKYVVVANTGDSRCIMSLPGGAPKTLSFDHKPSTMGERVRIENSGGYVINNRVNEILALSRAFGDFKFKIPYVEPSRDYYYMDTNKEYFTKHGFIKIPPELNQVTVEPDLLVYDLSQLDKPEFVILACDGIWDCYTNKELIKVIRDKLGLGWTLTTITELVLNNCIEMANNITGIGFDNMTMIIVAVHLGNSIHEWYEQMQQRILREKNLV